MNRIKHHVDRWYHGTTKKSFDTQLAILERYAFLYPSLNELQHSVMRKVCALQVLFSAINYKHE